jgi:hypothetical protein
LLLLLLACYVLLLLLSSSRTLHVQGRHCSTRVYAAFFFKLV